MRHGKASLNCQHEHGPSRRPAPSPGSGGPGFNTCMRFLPRKRRAARCIAGKLAIKIAAMPSR